MINIKTVSNDELNYTDSRTIKEDIALQLKLAKQIGAKMDEFIRDNLEDHGPQIIGTVVSATSSVLLSFMRTVAHFSEDEARLLFDTILKESYKND